MLNLEVFLARQLLFEFLNYALSGSIENWLWKKKKQLVFCAEEVLGRLKDKFWLVFYIPCGKPGFNRNYSLKKNLWTSRLYLQCLEECLVPFTAKIKVILLADWRHMPSAEENYLRSYPVLSSNTKTVFMTLLLDPCLDLCFSVSLENLAQS
jgi:hypothetical protein